MYVEPLVILWQGCDPSDWHFRKVTGHNFEGGLEQGTGRRVMFMRTVVRMVQRTCVFEFRRLGVAS